ncbi:MAG: ATP-binding cassette domain-containing protein [Gammaproteobacteria bacterium]|nr:ATP-binding cassette domain-containing protein [Gammaproteobacteria bacterium]
MIALQASDVSKSFDNVNALDNVSLQVDNGDVLGLLGPNGAGKTTLINVFLGLVKPDTGRVLVLGKNPIEDPRDVRNDISYVPELVALYPELTALQNLEFFNSFNEDPCSNDELRQCLFDVRLNEKFHHNKTKTLSKGMCQKVGLAIALAKNARVIFMDEPWTGLDPESASEFSDQIRTTRNRGTTILLATHDLFHLSGLASHIGLLRNGRLSNLVSSHELDAKELEQLYLDHMRQSD